MAGLKKCSAAKQRPHSQTEKGRPRGQEVKREHEYGRKEGGNAGASIIKCLPQAHIMALNNTLSYTVFSRLNVGDVYLKLGLIDPAFIRTRRLFGAQRLFI